MIFLVQAEFQKMTFFDEIANQMDLAFWMFHR